MKKGSKVILVFLGDISKWFLKYLSFGYRILEGSGVGVFYFFYCYLDLFILYC